MGYALTLGTPERPGRPSRSSGHLESPSPPPSRFCWSGFPQAEQEFSHCFCPLQKQPFVEYLPRLDGGLLTDCLTVETGFVEVRTAVGMQQIFLD